MAEPVITFGRPGQSQLDPEALSAFFARVDADAKATLGYSLDQGDGFRDRLHRDYGRGFDAMNLLYFAAMDAFNWAKGAIHEVVEGNDDHEEFGQYYLVVCGLAARALSAYAEVTWLLRGGYPRGALTRVRFLHELFLTAEVLAQHGKPDGEHPDLISAYLEHRDVFTRATADDLSATGALDDAEYFDQDVLAALDQRRTDLLARYGKSFAGMWGWAAPLFPANGRISTKMIGALVSPELHYLYSMTSAHVHAGSEGWYETFIERGDEQTMASGALNVQLALPAVLATAFLLELVQVVVPSKIERDGAVEEVGAFFQAALDRMGTSISDHMWHGEEIVEQAEARYQKKAKQGDTEKNYRPTRIRTLALRLVHRAERRLRRDL